MNLLVTASSWKKAIFAVVLIVLSSSTAKVAADRSDSDHPNLHQVPQGSITVEDEYIVVLNENVVDVAGTMKYLMEAVTEKYPTHDVVEKLSSIWNINDSFKGQSVKMARVQAQFMSLMEDVKYIEQNIEEQVDFESTSTSDDNDDDSDEGMLRLAVENTGDVWGVDRIDQRALPLNGEYAYDYNGTGVIAYIMDGGIRATHEDIRDNMSPDVPDPPFADEFDDDRCLRHGTHIAGTSEYARENYP